MANEFWRKPGDPGVIPRWMGAGQSTTQADQDRFNEEYEREGTRITDFPKHLYPPAAAQTVNLIRAVIVEPGATIDLITFQPKFHGIVGASVIFTHYGIFNDGLNAANFSFQPLVNGQRVYPYHGSPVDLSGQPSQSFRIALGMGPDLSDVSLVNGMLALANEDTLIWRVTNLDVVQVAMGVRHVGYIDQGSKNVERRFGG